MTPTDDSVPLAENSLEQEQSSGNHCGMTGVLSDSELCPHGSGNSGQPNSNSHSHSHSTKCTSEEDSSSITSESGQLGTNSQNNSAQLNSSPLRMKTIKSKISALNERITANANASNVPLEFYTAAEFEQIRSKLDERTQDCLRFSEEIDVLKGQFQSDCTILNQALQDEKYRFEVSG